VSQSRLPRLLAPAALVAILAIAAPAVHAQQARFKGKVKDASGVPVARAILHLEPTDARGVKVHVGTDRAGTFFLGLVRPGSYNVRIEAPGGLVITEVKGQAVQKGRKDTDWTVDQKVGPNAPVTLTFEDERDVTVNFVLGSPAAVAAPSGVGQPDIYQAVLEKVQKGDCEGALPDIETMRTSSPDNARAQYLGSFCLERLGRHDEALAAIERTLQIQADFAGGTLMKGRVLKSLGRGQEAEAEFKREVEGTQHDSVRTDALAALVLLYKEQDRVDEAIAALERLIQLQPQRGEAYVELSSLHGKKGDRVKAAEVLERAKQAGASADPVATLNVGIGFLNDKNYDAAAAEFRKVIEAEGTSKSDVAMAWALLGRCQLNAGQIDEGTASLEKSLEIDPQGTMADENRQILAAMKPKK